MTIIVTGSVFNLPPYARERKNHWNVAGIKPGSQVTALSITPCLLASLLVKFLHVKMPWRDAGRIFEMFHSQTKALVPSMKLI